MTKKQLFNLTIKEAFLILIFSINILLLTSCVTSQLRRESIQISQEELAIKQKFRGIRGGILYFDSTGHTKEYITIYNEKEIFWRSELQIDSGARQSTYTDALYLPKSIRVEWRTDYKSGTRGKLNSRGRPDGTNLGWEGGNVLGNYTVPLATRIPDDVLDYIRANGGALRAKIRLKDNGVAIGWDIEKQVLIPNLPADHIGGKYAIDYIMAGGDFREAQIYNGKVIDPGWEK